MIVEINRNEDYDVDDEDDGYLEFIKIKELED